MRSPVRKEMRLKPVVRGVRLDFTTSFLFGTPARRLTIECGLARFGDRHVPSRCVTGASEMNKLPNYDPAEHTPRPEDLLMTRRDLLRRTGMGMGTLSLALLLGENMVSTPAGGAELPQVPRSGHSMLAPRRPQFAGKAKRVIHIFAGGGPSHVDTFDPKPTLT